MFGWYFRGCLSFIFHGLVVIFILFLIICGLAIKNREEREAHGVTGTGYGGTADIDYDSLYEQSPDERSGTASEYDTSRFEGVDVKTDSAMINRQIVVTAKSAANFRKGPGTEYDIVVTIPHGYTFVATGRTATKSKGGLWYEIYIRGGLELVWASEQVVAPKE